jgi:SAM-dependent methyltransferase
MAAHRRGPRAVLAPLTERMLDLAGVGVGYRGLESFDAAISRLALMLLPKRALALAGIHRALKPGKKFVALVLATADECPFIALPLGIAARRAGTPQAPFGDPGMFALGDPGVLAAAYRDVGFREVAVEAAPVQRLFPSLAVAVQSLRDALPEIPQLLMHTTDAERAEAWAEIEVALRQFDGTDEFVVPHTYLIGVGTK